MSDPNKAGPLVPVILSGGAGTRLWPVSRRAHPKPFMQLVDGESLTEKTFNRAMKVANGAPVLTVTSRDYYFFTRDLYNNIAGEEHQHPFLLERYESLWCVVAGLGVVSCLRLVPAIL